MPVFQSLHARQILDSRGTPTVEVDCMLSDGSFGRAAVPSGASTGSFEAVELRDDDPKFFFGKGVMKAVGHVNGGILKAVKGNEFDQRTLDDALRSLDGTENKATFGANAILGVSLSFARASALSAHRKLYNHFGSLASEERRTMPVPMMLMLEGGKHADESSDFQEFMVMPVGAKSFSEALRWGDEIYHATGKVLKSEGYNVNVGFEGAYGPSLGSNEKVIEILLKGIEAAGYKPGRDVGIALDCAASEFFSNGIYDLKAEGKKLSSAELIAFYERWVSRYPVISIEDGLAEEDWAGWASLTSKLGTKIQIVGDDLFVTNVKRIEKGISGKSANAVLIRLNQIGTVSETVDAVTMAKKAGWHSIVSHRAGETEDSSIADFAVGLAMGQIKTGAPCRSDRTSKYNQLLRIEEELGEGAGFKSPF